MPGTTLLAGGLHHYECHRHLLRGQKSKQAVSYHPEPASSTPLGDFSRICNQYGPELNPVPGLWQALKRSAATLQNIVSYTLLGQCKR